MGFKEEGIEWYIACSLDTCGPRRRLWIAIVSLSASYGWIPTHCILDSTSPVSLNFYHTCLDSDTHRTINGFYTHLHSSLEYDPNVGVQQMKYKGGQVKTHDLFTFTTADDATHPLVPTSEQLFLPLNQ
jgi:hypothetical protein